MTDSNVKDIYTGTTDIPLCEEGKKQLAELLDKYDYGKPDLIFTSPLIRCKQTAHIILARTHGLMWLTDCTSCRWATSRVKPPSR